jgi:phosphatidylglycerol---prolipoprotein diacylglyceryl transferase
MYPILFKIPLLGGIPVYSYGLLVATGIVAGILWVRYDARRFGLDPAKAMDLVFYVVLFGIIGSRVVYIIVAEWNRFLQNPLIFFRIWEGGLVFYGGVIFSLIASLWFFRKYKLPVMKYLDIFAPALALGHSIGRLGCLMAGCCYGKPTALESWFSIIFPKNVGSFAPQGIPLFPTQLMESLGEFSIFWILFFLRKHKRFDGQIFGSYLILYGIVRFVVEFFRGDLERGYVLQSLLSISQLMSLVIVAFGLLIHLNYFLRSRKQG